MWQNYSATYWSGMLTILPHEQLNHSVMLCHVSITAKPGECPPQTSGRRLCTTSCNSDSNCPTNEKCCSNGCGHYCTPPYTVKPGQCPKLNKIPAGAESCFHDGQCPATQKCCPTTSGHACSEP
uniref:WAP domain-containing protein n=1 Tax=Cyprinus carpio TaxID=7962 RepID=A0A8C1WAC8_CYPCA